MQHFECCEDANRGVCVAARFGAEVPDPRCALQTVPAQVVQPSRARLGARSLLRDAVQQSRMGRAQAAWTRWTRAAAAPPAAAALDRTSGASSGNADGAGAGAADAPEHVRVVANFLPAGQAAALRAAFDAKFEDPYATSPERFVWDFWHVPGQYSQMRTPALDFFCEADYSTLEAALLEHGKAELGCVGVTQIWLSYYVGAAPAAAALDLSKIRLEPLLLFVAPCDFAMFAHACVPLLDARKVVSPWSVPHRITPMQSLRSCGPRLVSVPAISL